MEFRSTKAYHCSFRVLTEHESKVDDANDDNKDVEQHNTENIYPLAEDEEEMPSMK